MKRRIGILTSGGDCPGLNAAIRGVARAAYEMFDAEIIGISDGYRGLIEGEWQEMKRSQFSGILTLGGTILGTSRTPFRNMRVIENDNVDKVKAMVDTYEKLKAYTSVMEKATNGSLTAAEAMLCCDCHLDILLAYLGICE